MASKESIYVWKRGEYGKVAQATGMSQSLVKEYVDLINNNNGSIIERKLNDNPSYAEKWDWWMRILFWINAL